MNKIRVLIVDDSPIVRSVLSRIISAERDMEVLATAADPFEAKEYILRERPDVVTLDVEMPRMDGITFLKRIMSYKPIPVLMISSYTHENSMRTMEALEAGAVDFVPKPTHDLENSLDQLSREIVSKVRAAGWAKVRPALVRPKTEAAAAPKRTGRLYRYVAVGSSTGGTQAIQRLLSGMSYRTNGIVVVQHMPAKYTHSFAQRLDSLVPQTVREAADRDRLERDLVLIAPGGRHMRVVKDAKGYSVRLDDGPPVNHQRPSVDVLFQSAAESMGADAVGVILTGMGEDGARGLLAMRESGALTLAQDEESCVVFGMPRAAIDKGAVVRVASLSDLPDVIYGAARRRKQ